MYMPFLSNIRHQSTTENEFHLNYCRLPVYRNFDLRPEFDNLGPSHNDHIRIPVRCPRAEVCRLFCRFALACVKIPVVCVHFDCTRTDICALSSILVVKLKDNILAIYSPLNTSSRSYHKKIF